MKEGQIEERESGCEVVEWLKSEGMSLKKVTTNGERQRLTRRRVKYVESA